MFRLEKIQEHGRQQRGLGGRIQQGFMHLLEILEIIGDLVGFAQMASKTRGAIGGIGSGTGGDGAKLCRCAEEGAGLEADDGLVDFGPVCSLLNGGGQRTGIEQFLIGAPSDGGDGLGDNSPVGRVQRRHLFNRRGEDEVLEQHGLAQPSKVQIAGRCRRMVSLST